MLHWMYAPATGSSGRRVRVHKIARQRHAQTSVLHKVNRSNDRKNKTLCLIGRGQRMDAFADEPRMYLHTSYVCA